MLQANGNNVALPYASLTSEVYVQEALPAMTTGKRLARNALWNLAGQVGPLFIALLAIPLILRGLGTERFGLLNIIWVVVGYFGLFDMGIGRATTKFAAEHLARNEAEQAAGLVWSSIAMLAGLGLLGGAVLAALAPRIVHDLLNIPPALHGEAVRALHVLAVAVPFVLCSAGLRGVLEAQQRFRLINTIKLPVMIVTVAAPLAVIAFTHDLAAITAALAACRVSEFLLFGAFGLSSLPGLLRPRIVRLPDLRRLLGFGGWLTLSNIIGPLMTYMDRFLISGVLSLAAVAYYATPYDLANRLAIIPGSALAVLFPALTARAAADPARLRALYERSIAVVLLVLTPLVLCLILFSDVLLAAWLGADFARQSTLVLQMLLAGVLLNAVAQVSLTAIQALGRPDLTSKLHLMELPLYLGALWFLVARFGIAGAAIASLARIAVDMVLLTWAAFRMMPDRGQERSSLIGILAVVAAMAAVTAAVAVWMPAPTNRLAVLGVMIVAALLLYQGYTRGAKGRT